jgi:sugar-phosphatase
MLGRMNPPPATAPTFAAFLFDMDGTLLSSLAAAERVWGAWARRHGLDVERLLPTIHGRQAVETIRDLGVPGLDPEAEGAWVLARELEDVGGIHPIAGAARFLASLPPERWIIVTSAPRDLALRRLAAAGLPPSRTMVTADEVPNGKPAPDCYLLAARKLGVDIADCLVFEDAPAGIASAEAAGAPVVVITALHPRAMVTGHTQVADFEGLTAHQGADGRLSIEERGQVFRPDPAFPSPPP